MLCTSCNTMMFRIYNSWYNEWVWQCSCGAVVADGVPHQLSLFDTRVGEER